MPVEKASKSELAKWNAILLNHDLGSLWIIDQGPKLCYGEFAKSDGKEDIRKQRPFNYTLEGERKGNHRGNFTIPSAETCHKMSVSHMGRKVSRATKAKMSAAHLGMVFTPEHKANIRAAALTRTPRQATPILCIHLDRPHYGLGKCWPCYLRDYRAKKKAKHLRQCEGARKANLTKKMNTQTCVKCHTKANHLTDGLCVNCVIAAVRSEEAAEEEYWQLVNTPPMDTTS